MIWRHDGQRLSALTVDQPLGIRGAGREIQRPAGELTGELVEWLRQGNGVDGIEAWSFVVPPQD